MNKPRFARLEETEAECMLKSAGALDLPHLYPNILNEKISWWADAEELRAWRLQHTSGGNGGQT